MLFDKIGLAGGKDDINPEITASGFKTYQYTNKDAHNYYEKYEVLELEINVPFKILNGTLTINGKDYDISDKLLSDVYDIFNKYGTATLFRGFEEFAKLPAVLLCDCSNTFTTSFDGDISPLSLDYRQRNFTINSYSYIDSELIVFDSTRDTPKEYQLRGKNIYYEPSRTTKIHITSMSTHMYLMLDFSPRRVSSSTGASYLLNFRKNDNEL